MVSCWHSTTIVGSLELSHRFSDRVLHAADWCHAPGALHVNCLVDTLKYDVNRASPVQKRVVRTVQHASIFFFFTFVFETDCMTSSSCQNNLKVSSHNMIVIVMIGFDLHVLVLVPGFNPPMALLSVAVLDVIC